MSDEKRMDTALLAENDENTAAEENALVMKLDKPFTFERSEEHTSELQSR